MSGKGSKPRPLSVPRKQFDDNWERIFGKKTPKEIDDAIAEDEGFKQVFDKQVVMKPEYYDLDPK